MALLREDPRGRNAAQLWTLPAWGLTLPPLIFGSYGPFETLLFLVTKN